MLQAQNPGAFWVVDLGSANGTYLNGRRIIQPSLLSHGDQIKIGDHIFTFHRADSDASEASHSNVEQTVPEIKTLNCWLLVADIESSTQLTRRVPPEELPHITGRWLSTCKKVIEDRGGAINKFLGDGFFAYWYGDDGAEGAFTEALVALRNLQEDNALRFRIVAHFGKVFIGGAASLGEESLFGSDVNFVFRMEKLAGALGIACLVSEPVKTRLERRLPSTDAGRHALSGFDGTHAFYSF